MRAIIILFLIFSIGCTKAPLYKNHGYTYLETKIKLISINKSNKNDVKKIIGPPSIVSKFDENIWFYLEREKRNQKIIKLGIEKINKNNVMILKFSGLGVLEDKQIIDINSMNELTFAKDATTKKFENKNVIYNVLSSLREKINAPARNRSRSKNN